MTDFNYTGGVRFAPDKVVDVTADKDGNPTKACNPITGVCLEGESDFSTAEVTINKSGEGLLIPRIDTENNYTAAGVFSTGVFSMVLYKNLGVIEPYDDSETLNIVGGDAEYGDPEHKIILVTGDCVVGIADS